MSAKIREGQIREVKDWWTGEMIPVEVLGGGARIEVRRVRISPTTRRAETAEGSTMLPRAEVEAGALLAESLSDWARAEQPTSVEAAQDAAVGESLKL